MKRREFLQAASVAVAAAGVAGAKTAQTSAPVGKTVGGTTWYDLATFPIEGRAFADTASPFDRLPARAEKLVRKAVWNLSRHSAGLCVRFETDAPTISAQWTLTSASLAMPHMPATGVSGLDLYARDDRGTWRWVANARPGGQKNSTRLVSGLPAGRRSYTLYLPLYNGVSALSLGVPKGAALTPLPRRKTRPVVVYGTSIVQGGCASRPGMVHTSILSRRLDREFVNLGFSGNGTMETAVGQWMARIEAGVYVIDCLPNMQPAQVAQRTGPLVTLLRKARPKAPIVLVEDRNYSNGWLLEAPRRRNLASQAALKKAHEQLVAAGVKGLYYVRGETLLGDDAEATVDSSHPTDLGFVRMADALEPVLRPLV